MKRASTVVVAALCLFLAACEQGTSTKFSDKFDKINTGMSQVEVEKIMGKGKKQDVGGVGISASGIAGGASQNSQVTYVWTDGTKEITATFADGKMVAKGKAGF